MAILERIWELTGLFFSTILGGFERSVTSFFGSSNQRQVRRMQGRIDRMNAFEPEVMQLSDEALRAKTDEFRKRLAAGETLDDILEEAFAVCREAGRRWLGMRHYDTQFVGGIVLHEGKIAEMVTGEGKTLVATLPAYLNALEGSVHVITVNDYLARRDMEWMAPLYMGLGLTVGAIQSGMDTLERQKAYSKDITYGTNNEFGFDYLRDNMRPARRGDDRFPKDAQQSQGPLRFAIIDEVDNILIDEARTPLIISGPAHMNPGKYAEADRVARQLKRETHFVVDEKNRSANLTDEGVREAERLAGVESFYTAGNMEWPHLIDNSLKAHHLYKLDVNYVVKEGAVIIVDEFTGRLMEGRQWSDGLHQAVEAKEGVKIKEETQTFATITLQNYFKLYEKLAGMTGTAMTEAGEFWKIYRLEVVAIPTNRKMQRIENPDAIYLTEADKFKAVADDIERVHKWDVVVPKKGEPVLGKIHSQQSTDVVITPKFSKERVAYPISDTLRIERAGRPILVGTVSIEKSERLSRLLEVRGIPHQVLNAKHHRREAEIVAQAGRLGAVTIATNMAGRGTDIILGGNPETMAWARLQDKYPTRLEVPQEEWDALVEQIETAEKMKEQGEAVRSLGGLYVLGTERHESRRIDLQLRGRCGRQGDPGGSRFYLSLEDDLMRIFAGDFVKSLLTRMGMKEGEAIESPMVTRRIAAAQKKVEERHFDQRKSLLDYDEVMDEQRKRVYRFRQQILDGQSCRNLVLEQIDSQIALQAKAFLEADYATLSFVTWAGQQLGCPLEAADFRGMDFDAAERYAKDVAERQAEEAVYEAIEENLPSGEEETEWNWQALATWSNTRYGTNFRDRDLKSLQRSELEDTLIKGASRHVENVDLKPGAPFLADDYGAQNLSHWMKSKFGVVVPPEKMHQQEVSDVLRLLHEHAEASYRERESVYPVLTGLRRYSDTSGNSAKLDRDGLAHWAKHRFGAAVVAEEFHGLGRDEIVNRLLEASRGHTQIATTKYSEIKTHIADLFVGGDKKATAREASGGNGSLDRFTGWVTREFSEQLGELEIAEMDREQLERKINGAVDEQFHPEMRRMECIVLLNIVDTAWKEHLLVMDHLRSSVGLKSFAQMDPKVEYKREGMRLFDLMWRNIAERATDLIFRMESLNDDFVRSTWIAPKASHDQAQSLGESLRGPAASASAASSSSAQDVASESQKGNAKPEPIRNQQQRVGRNDPCPCGSGKKFKNCCIHRS